MLSEEHKAKIQAAIESLNNIIESLDGSLADPRAVNLLDIAASYLEEQHEQGVEYKEESLDEDINYLPGKISDFFEETPMDFTIEETSQFKFFNADSVESLSSEEAEEAEEELRKAFDRAQSEKQKKTMPTKIDPEALAKEIQAWYLELDNQSEEN